MGEVSPCPVLSVKTKGIRNNRFKFRTHATGQGNLSNMNNVAFFDEQNTAARAFGWAENFNPLGLEVDSEPKVNHWATIPRNGYYFKIVNKENMTSVLGQPNGFSRIGEAIDDMTFSGNHVPDH